VDVSLQIMKLLRVSYENPGKSPQNVEQNFAHAYEEMVVLPISHLQINTCLVLPES